MSVTCRPRQPLRSWLNAEAPSNIQLMSLTLSTAQSPMSWLKDEASMNIKCIVVTPDGPPNHRCPGRRCRGVGIEHAVHRCDARGVPRTDVLVEGPLRLLRTCLSSCDKYVRHPRCPTSKYGHIASAAVASDNHAVCTAIFQLTMTLPDARSSHSPPLTSHHRHNTSRRTGCCCRAWRVVHAPAEVLVEGRCVRTSSISCNLVDCPTTDVLVKGGGAAEHPGHVRDAVDRPTTDVLVEFLALWNTLPMLWRCPPNHRCPG